jgi:hypothetical protein
MFQCLNYPFVIVQLLVPRLAEALDIYSWKGPEVGFFFLCEGWRCQAVYNVLGWEGT